MLQADFITRKGVLGHACCVTAERRNIRGERSAAKTETDSYVYLQILAM